MKHFLPGLCMLMAATAACAQDKCNCPPLKLYVYDTRMDFSPDSADGDAAAKYVEAQNSGDWLEGSYLKQQSDEFRVYKNIRPGAKTGSTYEPPPADGGSPGDNIDFTSYAEISRGGNTGAYIYTILVKIFNARNHDIVASISRTTSDLGKADDMIDACISSFGPVPDQLHNYQKKLRDQSGNTKWIGAKWKTDPDKDHLKIYASTTVHIKAFDCLDEKPIPNQEIRLRLTSDKPGILNVKNVKTNASGEATVTFSAMDNGETRVVPDFTYTDVNDKSGWHGTVCSDQGNIVVADPVYLIRINAELTGPEDMHYKLSGDCIALLEAYADSTYGLRPKDGSKHLHIFVVTAGVPGKMTLTGPKNYDIPFVLNIGNLGKKLTKTAPATLSIESFSPTEAGITQPEYYQTPAGSLTLTGNINAIFSNTFSQTTVTSGMESADKAKQDLPWVQRMRANKNNLAYLNSPQGKADLQQMQKLLQEHGTSLPQGMIATQSNATASRTVPDAYKPTVMGGTFHAGGTFNPNADAAMEIEKEETTGPLHGTIKIQVVRTQ